jgi:(p)ppGpp synthase/HD superfamily hydrolase
MTKIILPDTEILTPEQLTLREKNLRTFHKAVSAMRYRMLGLAKANPDWYRAIHALEFNLAHHTGWRKDKVTPAAYHQVSIANHVMTFMSDLIDPVRTVIAALCHDTPEDTPVSHAEIRDEFGPESEEDVELLTKKYRGVSKDPDAYHNGWANNFVTSVVKPIDRVDNVGSMGGVFGLPKQIDYCDETVNRFLPGLKHARRSFPRQEAIYENLKLTLKRIMLPYQIANARGVAI